MTTSMTTTNPEVMDGAKPGLRMVTAKRARKLRKRGENVWLATNNRNGTSFYFWISKEIRS